MHHWYYYCTVLLIDDVLVVAVPTDSQQHKEVSYQFVTVLPMLDTTYLPCYIVLYCTVLYCTVLYCLYTIVLVRCTCNEHCTNREDIEDRVDDRWCQRSRSCRSFDTNSKKREIIQKSFSRENHLIFQFQVCCIESDGRQPARGRMRHSTLDTGHWTLYFTTCISVSYIWEWR